VSETEYTTITVRKRTKERLNEHRDGRPWDQYLEKLRREHADPVTLNDMGELADSLEDELSLREGFDADTLAIRVSERIDYTQLANRVADELHGRMQ